jgi:hypothetical protein
MVRRSKGCVEGVRYRDVWPFEVLANISSTRLRFVSRCQCIGDIGHKNLPRVSAIIRHPRKDNPTSAKSGVAKAQQLYAKATADGVEAAKDRLKTLR